MHAVMCEYVYQSASYCKELLHCNTDLANDDHYVHVLYVTLKISFCTVKLQKDVV